jgi:hypothetical protein
MVIAWVGNPPDPENADPYLGETTSSGVLRSGRPWAQVLYLP